MKLVPRRRPERPRHSQATSSTISCELSAWYETLYKLLVLHQKAASPQGLSREFIPLLVIFPAHLHHKQSSNMSHDAATQTPDWSQNNDAYFAGSNHVIISSEPYRTTQGNRPPPKAIACQTELNLPRIQFRENDLETALNALGGFGESESFTPCIRPRKLIPFN